jgi:hypothetical protein
MAKNKMDQGDISTSEALEEEDEAIAAAAADKKDALWEARPPEDAPESAKKSSGAKGSREPEIEVSTSAMRKQGDFAPRFFQVQGETEESGPLVCVVFDINRDFLPSNVSGSTAIRQQSFCFQSGFEDAGDGTQKATFKTLTLKIGANFVNAQTWADCRAYFAKEKTFTERINKKILYTLEPKTTVTKITNLNDFAEGDAIAIITNTYDEEMLKEWQRQAKSTNVSKAIAQQIKALQETVNNIAQKKRSMASA